VSYFISELAAKRLSLLRELLPAAVRVGALVNPNAAIAEAFTKDSGSFISIQVEIAHARDSREIEAAFATLARNKID
jgi:putative ABC transport system substrate-binding protein